jgi:hypothetical protein
MAAAGFEPVVRASERRQTVAFDVAANWDRRRDVGWRVWSEGRRTDYPAP